jgi:DNA-binding transcriptional regulator YiaG
MEIWKDIQGYEGLYQISNLGRVKSLPKKTPGTNTTKTSYLKHCFRCGYQYVSLSNNGKSQKQMIHRLLAIHFIENPDQKKCVNHKNGIRSDFSLENLEWCNQSENELHAYKLGLKNTKGEKHNQAKLNNECIGIIRKSNISQSELAVMFGVTQTTISGIKTGKSWSHVAC